MWEIPFRYISREIIVVWEIPFRYISREIISSVGDPVPIYFKGDN